MDPAASITKEKPFYCHGEDGDGTAGAGAQGNETPGPSKPCRLLILKQRRGKKLKGIKVGAGLGSSLFTVNVGGWGGGEGGEGPPAHRFC